MELMRPDLIFPLYVEVDEIFNLGRVDEFWRNDVFGIPELNQT